MLFYFTAVESPRIILTGVATEPDLALPTTGAILRSTWIDNYKAWLMPPLRHLRVSL